MVALPLGTGWSSISSSFCRTVLACLAGSFAFLTAPAANLFVWQESPDPCPPYAEWTTAAHTIQEAVDAALPRDTVWVTNGVYETGSSTLKGSAQNRVTVTKAVSLFSVNGPSVTEIRGRAADSGDLQGNGQGAVRCMYLGANAVLNGFALTSGHTREWSPLAPLSDNDVNGGGVYCESSAVLVNCIIAHCAAGKQGGGVWRGRLDNCLLITNTAAYGGAVSFGLLRHCTLNGNTAQVVRNRTGDAPVGGLGGGTYAGTLFNCIVSDNTAPTGDNYHNSSLLSSCTVPLPGTGSGNIAAPPGFVDAPAGDFRLRQDSPCIDSGRATPVACDLEGSLRPLDGNGDGVEVPDIGAYEFDLRPLISQEWLLGHGLDPADPHVVAVDSDGDGHTTYQEWVSDTDPNDPQSVFRLEAIQAGPAASVCFLSSTNRFYTLSAAPDVAGLPQASTAGKTTLRGTGGLLTLTTTNTFGNQFFRVEVQVP